MVQSLVLMGMFTITPDAQLHHTDYSFKYIPAVPPRKTIAGNSSSVVGGGSGVVPGNTAYNVIIKGALGLATGVTATFPFTSAPGPSGGYLPNFNALGLPDWYIDNLQAINTAIQADSRFSNYTLRSLIPTTSATYEWNGTRAPANVTGLSTTFNTNKVAYGNNQYLFGGASNTYAWNGSSTSNAVAITGVSGYANVMAYGNGIWIIGFIVATPVSWNGNTASSATAIGGLPAFSTLQTAVFANNQWILGTNANGCYVWTGTGNATIIGGISATAGITSAIYANSKWYIGTNAGLWQWTGTGNATLITQVPSTSTITSLQYNNGIFVIGTLANGALSFDGVNTAVQISGISNTARITDIGYANGRYLIGTIAGAYTWDGVNTATLIGGAIGVSTPITSVAYNNGEWLIGSSVLAFAGVYSWNGDPLAGATRVTGVTTGVNDLDYGNGLFIIGTSSGSFSFFGTGTPPPLIFTPNQPAVNSSITLAPVSGRGFSSELYNQAQSSEPAWASVPAYFNVGTYGANGNLGTAPPVSTSITTATSTTAISYALTSRFTNTLSGKYTDATFSLVVPNGGGGTGNVIDGFKDYGGALTLGTNNAYATNVGANNAIIGVFNSVRTTGNYQTTISKPLLTSGSMFAGSLNRYWFSTFNSTQQITKKDINSIATGTWATITNPFGASTLTSPRVVSVKRVGNGATIMLEGTVAGNYEFWRMADAVITQFSAASAWTQYIPSITPATADSNIVDFDISPDGTKICIASDNQQNYVAIYNYTLATNTIGTLIVKLNQTDVIGSVAWTSANRITLGSIGGSAQFYIYDASGNLVKTLTAGNGLAESCDKYVTADVELAIFQQTGYRSSGVFSDGLIVIVDVVAGTTSTINPAASPSALLPYQSTGICVDLTGDVYSMFNGSGSVMFEFYSDTINSLMVAGSISANSLSTTGNVVASGDIGATGDIFQNGFQVERIYRAVYNMTANTAYLAGWAEFTLPWTFLSGDNLGGFLSLTAQTNNAGAPNGTLFTNNSVYTYYVDVTVDTSEQIGSSASNERDTWIELNGVRQSQIGKNPDSVAASGVIANTLKWSEKTFAK